MTDRVINSSARTVDVNLSKDGTLAYVINESGNSVSVIDTPPTTPSSPPPRR